MEPSSQYHSGEGEGDTDRQRDSPEYCSQVQSEHGSPWEQSLHATLGKEAKTRMANIGRLLSGTL